MLRVSAGLAARVGGPAASTVTSCCAGRNAGIETTLAVISHESVAALEALRLHGVTVLEFSPSGGVLGRWSMSVGFLRWVVLGVRPFDVIHVHGAWTMPTIVAVMAARVWRRPVVLTPHESLSDFDIAKSPLLGRIVKLRLRRLYRRLCAAIVCASELEKQASGGRRCVVLAHPVPRGKASSTLLPASEHGFRIGFLGRFDSKKNLELLIRALPDGVELLVAGDGPARSRLVELAADCGVSGRVRWLGFLGATDRTRFFASIDALAMPSAYESFGMAAAEALAAGVPVLVSPSTGVARMVRQYDCGVVVEPTVAALHAALSRPDVIRNKSNTTSLAAEQEFGLHAHGVGLRRLYETVAT